MPDIEILFEAMAAKPNFRYDIIQPLLQGRAPIDGVTLKTTGWNDTAPIFKEERFKNGEFGILDTNIGDILPAIDAGWDFVVLPVLIKRKPVYNYAWVRADRGIDSVKDVEGKTWASSSWGVVTTYTRGMLKRFHGVDITANAKWIVNGSGPWKMHVPVDVTYPELAKPQWQRLLEGEADACTGDIIDHKAWEILEASPDKVKRLFPDYREMHRDLWRDHQIVTPSHVVVIGGKTHRAHPGLARKIYDAFEQSREIAINDALGDGSSYNILLDARETMRDQLGDMGDIWKHGISANRNVIDITLDFYAEQGQTSRRLSIEEVFAEDCLDT